MDLRFAVFVDFENVAIEDTEKDVFQISLVLDRLKEKGKILLKRAYADWTRFARYRRELQDFGVEMIEMTTRGMTQKNAGDIKIVVDALETAFTRDYVTSFVIVSGDSDFTPLVSKLREYNKTVLGIGRRSSTSRLFIEQCDEFILYETLVKQRPPAPVQGDLFSSLKDALVALDRQGISEPHFSRVKEALTRKNPAFDETAAGFKTFGRFLEAAQRKGILRILRDAATNTSRITLSVEEERMSDGITRMADSGSTRAQEAPHRLSEAAKDTESSQTLESSIINDQANGAADLSAAPEPPSSPAYSIDPEPPAPKKPARESASTVSPSEPTAQATETPQHSRAAAPSTGRRRNTSTRRTGVKRPSPRRPRTSRSSKPPEDASSS